jgi:hypothetical protein
MEFVNQTSCCRQCTVSTAQQCADFSLDCVHLLFLEHGTFYCSGAFVFLGSFLLTVTFKDEYLLINREN